MRRWQGEAWLPTAVLERSPRFPSYHSFSARSRKGFEKTVETKPRGLKQLGIRHSLSSRRITWFSGEMVGELVVADRVSASLPFHQPRFRFISLASVSSASLPFHLVEESAATRRLEYKGLTIENWPSLKKNDWNATKPKGVKGNFIVTQPKSQTLVFFVKRWFKKIVQTGNRVESC